jgi:hypothetical protein
VTKHEILKADLLDGAVPAGEHAEQPTKQQVEESTAAILSRMAG